MTESAQGFVESAVVFQAWKALARHRREMVDLGYAAAALRASTTARSSFLSRMAFSHAWFAASCFRAASYSRTICFATSPRLFDSVETRGCERAASRGRKKRALTR